MQAPIPVFNQKPAIVIQLPAPKPEPPKPVTYTVQDGDSLTTIAEAHSSSVSQLWAANTQLSNPDLIEPGIVLKIPQTVLPERPMPVTIQRESALTQKPSADAGGFSYSSGAYGVGWCTSYAAARHPVPSNLGNADSWLYMARADGLPTGFIPQVGSIAVAAAYSHVAIVEQVDGDRVLVSEQNYQGYGIISSRWTTTSEWQGYIY